MARTEHSVAPQPLRLFFALWPEDATRAALAGWSSAIHRQSGGRATRAETIHLTLAFLGDTDPARLPELEAAAARVRPRRFEFVLDEPGCWSHNKIAWAGATHVPEELERLVADLRAALVAAGFRFDPKPFVPHLTLIRKARPGFKLPVLAPILWPVREFVLVRSVLRAGGSEYVLQGRWG